MNPLISVIIPVFNTSLPIRRLLALLQNQTYENLEIICVDDGSTDDSLKQLKTLAKTEPRLKVLHQENSGASSARNLGLDHATGDYIAFIDSDDLITRDYFDLMINGLKNRDKHGLKQFPKDIKKSSAFSVCGFHYFRLKSNSQSDVFIDPLSKQGNTEPPRAYLLRLMAEDGRLYSSVNKLFHASIIRDNHLRFDPKKNFAEDTKFVFDYLDAWLKFVGEASTLDPNASAFAERTYPRIKLAPVLKPLYIYNFGTETSTVKKSSLLWQNWLDSFADFEEFAKPLPKPIAKKRLRQLKRRFGISHALAVARAPISKSKKLKYLKGWQLFLANIAIKFRP